jgi:hypothetical protein
MIRGAPVGNDPKNNIFYRGTLLNIWPNDLTHVQSLVAGT